MLEASRRLLAVFGGLNKNMSSNDNDTVGKDNDCGDKNLDDDANINEKNTSLHDKNKVGKEKDCGDKNLNDDANINEKNMKDINNTDLNNAVEIGKDKNMETIGNNDKDKNVETIGNNGEEKNMEKIGNKGKDKIKNDTIDKNKNEMDRNKNEKDTYSERALPFLLSPAKRTEIRVAALMKSDASVSDSCLLIKAETFDNGKESFQVTETIENDKDFGKLIEMNDDINELYKLEMTTNDVNGRTKLEERKAYIDEIDMHEMGDFNDDANELAKLKVSQAQHQFISDVTTDSHGIFKTVVKVPIGFLGIPVQEQSMIRVIAFKSADTCTCSLTIAVSIHSSTPLIHPHGISIISDVDDTIKESSVYIGKITAASEALLGDFKDVPGMANVYNLIAAKGASIHYVSGGPFQLLPTLNSFLAKFKYPKGSLNLRIVEKEKGPQYKHRILTQIMNSLPNRRFILVGDSGEKDIEIYEKIRATRPQQIIKVFIRHVGSAYLGLEDLKLASKKLEARAESEFLSNKCEGEFRWKLFRDPCDLLTDIHVVDELKLAQRV